MTDSNDNSNGASDEAPTTTPLPLGYWLRAVNAMIDREFATALASENVDRRDWMLLNAVSGDVEVPAWLAARAHGRGGKRLRALTERGWIEQRDDSWTLTDEGRAAHARLADTVGRIRERVSAAVSPEDFATMSASLEAIARDLGWDETQRMPRLGRHGRPGFGPGRGFGPGFRPGFGSDSAPAFGSDSGPAFGPGSGPAFGRGFGRRGEHGGAPEHCGRHQHGRHEHGMHGMHGQDARRGHGGEHRSERAFERGFDAGFRAAKERADAS